MAGDGGLAPVTPASPNAAAIRDIWWVILGITGVIFIIVETALVVFIVKYRRGRRPREVEGAPVHGNSRLEIIWTVVPVLIVFAIVAVVFVKLPDVKDAPAAANSLNIQVEGHQYYWLYRYPDGQVSIDQMVVPVDDVVTLTVNAIDVIHGWWIPALGGQIDAIPGRTNHTWFQAEKEGTYVGQCAQLCGVYHAKMTASVVVESEARSRVPRHDSDAARRRSGGLRRLRQVPRHAGPGCVRPDPPPQRPDPHPRAAHGRRPQPGPHARRRERLEPGTDRRDDRVPAEESTRAA